MELSRLKKSSGLLMISLMLNHVVPASILNLPQASTPPLIFADQALNPRIISVWREHPWMRAMRMGLGVFAGANMAFLRQCFMTDALVIRLGRVFIRIGHARRIGYKLRIIIIF